MAESLVERGGQFAKRAKQVKQGPQVKPNCLSLPQGTSESFLYARVPNNIFSMSAEKAEEGNVPPSVLTPPDIVENSEKAVTKLVPKTSRVAYDKAYQAFMEWRKAHEVGSFSERVILAYLEEKQKTLAPPTLWSMASMLKKTLLAYHNVNISNYGKVTPFLKQNQVGYKPKKAKIFTKEQIDKFLLTAPDDDFLMKKVCFYIILQELTFF